MAIEWKSKKMKIAELHDWDNNPRKINAAEYQKLLDDIRTYGFHDILKIDTDNVILSGNQRKKALTELGIEEVNVMYPDRKLTEKERNIVALVSNRHAGFWDNDILANKFDIEDLKLAGFQPFELGFAATEEIKFDTDDLSKTMDSYLDGNIKQIVVYFSNEQFEEIMNKLEIVREKMGVDNNTEVFINLVNGYEGN